MVGVNIIGIHKSGIKIKKSRKGLFTEYCGGKVTDECISKAKKSKNPKLRKRATFAANARKWKHLFGGNLSTKEQALQKLRLRFLKPYGGGQFGGGGAGSQFIEPKPEFELKKDTLWVPVLQSYNDAFADARRKGLKTFMFNGELKNTELGNDPRAQEAGSKRFLNIGVISIERTKKVEKEEKGGSVHKPFGHRAITDNGWISTKRLKKGNYGLIKTKQ